MAFDGSASSSPVSGGSYSWDFGDGNSASGTNPVHTYAGPAYEVALTVYDNNQISHTVGESITIEDADGQDDVECTYQITSSWGDYFDATVRNRQ